MSARPAWHPLEASPAATATAPRSGSAFVSGGGRMGARLRAHDWAATPLGPIGRWPLALRLNVETMMASQFPMCLCWGPELVTIHNDAYVPILGAKPDALGQSVAETWSETWSRLAPIFERALAGETTSVVDWQVRIERQGEPEDAWFTFCHGPIYDEHGRVVGVTHTVVETTAKILAERRVAAERAQLERLNAELEQQVIARTLARGRTWQLSPELICVIDPEGRFEASNPAWRTLLGWTEDDLARARAMDFVHPEDLPRAYEAWHECIAHGRTALHFEARHRVKSGGWRWLSWIAVPDEGKVYCTARDVQDQKARAEALAERTAERDLLARIVDSSGTQIQVVDLNGRVLAINRAASDEYQRVLGARPAVGDALLPFFDRLADPRDREIAVAFWRRALAGESFTIQRSFFDPKLAEHHLELRFEALRDADGVVVSTYAIVSDTSERVREQRALQEVQEALRQSQKMEAVGQLTGGIAHDFNNLLAAISGGLQMIRVRLARGQADGLERYLAMGETSVRRAAALTQRLLAFSRRQTLEPRPLDLNRLVRDIEEMIRRSVGPAVTLSVDAGAALWATRVDPSQLENALLNLCLNSRDAMLPAGGTLRIETANATLDEAAAAGLELTAGGYVVLSVTDTGTGIAPEALPRIFDPFFTTKPIGQGTGLGLSMVYGFARQSGGQVRASSRLGAGTTMRLYLPRHLGAVPPEPRSEPLPAAVPAGRGETVLLVEDEAPIRALVAEALGEAGYRVLLAEDGPTGLRQLQSGEPIDLLVSDIGLPGGLNGRQVATAGRALRPGLPVVFITGYVGDDAAVGNDRIEAGIQVLLKPFEIPTLVRRVRELLAAPPGAGAEAPAAAGVGTEPAVA